MIPETTYTTVETTCASCSSKFKREVKRGRPPTKCPSCREPDFGSSLLQFSSNGTGVIWVENSVPCLGCGKTFLRMRKKGRPPARCPDCQASVDAEKAAEVTVPDEKLEELYSGPKALLLGTKGETPKGAEAQCPRPRGCGRLFTSDGACEDHKIYGSNGNLACCKDPASLGMEPRERRGIPVWTRPTPREEEQPLP